MFMKRLCTSDCGMVASRVQLNLDDLLWVLTDSQLKAAIIFVNSLKEVIQKSTQQAKLRATDKLKVSAIGKLWDFFLSFHNHRVFIDNVFHQPYRNVSFQILVQFHTFYFTPQKNICESSSVKHVSCNLIVDSDL